MAQSRIDLERAEDLEELASLYKQAGRQEDYLRVLEEMSKMQDELEASLPQQQAAQSQQSEDDIFAGLPQEVVAQIKEEIPIPEYAAGRSEKGRRLKAVERRRKAAALEKLRMDNPYMADLVAETGPAEAFAVGAGEGFHTLVRGVGLADQREPGDPVGKSLAALEEQQPGAFKTGKLTAEVAPFVVPGAAAGNIARLGARTAATAGVGAAEGNIIARGEGGTAGEIAAATVLGGAIGGGAELALPYINQWGHQLIRRIRGRDPADPIIDETGNPSEELLSVLSEAGLDYEDLTGQVQRELRRKFSDPSTERFRSAYGQSVKRSTEALREAGFDLGDLSERAQKELLEEVPGRAGETAVQTARREAFGKIGLTGEAAPTRAQVERTKDLFQRQQELAKTSNLVNRRLEAQNAVIAGNFDQAIDATAGRAGLGGASAAEAVTGKALELDGKISDAYRAAREAAPREEIVKLDSAMSALNRMAPLKQRGDGTIQALKEEMRLMNIRAGETTTVIGPDGLSRRVSRTRPITVEQAESLRQFANSLFEGANPTGRRIIRKFKDALDSDVEKVAPDVFGEARAAKRRFEEDLSAAKLNKFDARETSLVRDVLDNEIDPSELFNKVALRGGKYRAGDLKQLKDYLHSGTPEQQLSGQIAWNDLRAEAIDFIKRNATVGAGGENEVRAITRDKMQKAMDRIGEGKMGVLFTGAERELLSDIKRVAALREPPPGTALGFGPSAQAIARVEGKLGMFKDLYQGVKNKIQSRHILKFEKRLESIAKNKEAHLKSLDRKAFEEARPKAAFAVPFSSAALATTASQSQPE